MRKIDNIKITYNIIWGLGILAILAFGIFLVPIKTEARVNLIQDLTVPINDKFNFTSSNFYYYQPYQTSRPVQNYYPVNTQANYYEIPTVYSNTSVAKTNTPTNTEEVEIETEDKYQGLAANVVFGDNSFLPSGLFQWILLGIFILIIIILTRMIFGRTKKFHETPLKIS